MFYFFLHSITVTVKKEGWGGGGTRTLSFSIGAGDSPFLKPAGKTLNISIGPGLPRDTSKETPLTHTQKGREGGRERKKEGIIIIF